MLCKWQQVMSIHLYWLKMEIYFPVDTTRSLQVLPLPLNLHHLVRQIILEALYIVDRPKATTRVQQMQLGIKQTANRLLKQGS